MFDENDYILSLIGEIAPGYISTDMNEALINDEKRAASILDRIPAGRWVSGL